MEVERNSFVGKRSDYAFIIKYPFWVVFIHNYYGKGPASWDWFNDNFSKIVNAVPVMAPRWNYTSAKMTQNYIIEKTYLTNTLGTLNLNDYCWSLQTSWKNREGVDQFKSAIILQFFLPNWTLYVLGGDYVTFLFYLCFPEIDGHWFFKLFWQLKCKQKVTKSPSPGFLPDRKTGSRPGILFAGNKSRNDRKFHSVTRIFYLIVLKWKKGKDLIIDYDDNIYDALCNFLLPFEIFKVFEIYIFKSKRERFAFQNKNI